MKRLPLIFMAFWLCQGVANSGPCDICFDKDDSQWMLTFLDERNVSQSAGWSGDPDIAVGPLGPAIGESPVVIVWSDDTGTPPAVNPERDREIWMAVSTDGGCSFSKYQLTANGADDDTPSVCYSVDQDFANVAFVTAGGVAGIRVDQVRTSPVFSPMETLTLQPLASAFQNVDITCGLGSSLNVYATWDAEVPDGPLAHRQVFFKRSRAGGAPGSWEGSDGGPIETSLTTGSVPTPSNSVDPSVATDLHSPFPGTSSVNVVFVNDGNCGVARSCIMFLRSEDGGTTFYGDPLGGHPAPVVISDTDRPIDVSEPSMGDNGGDGLMGFWYFALWLEHDGTKDTVMMDLQSQDASTYLQQWNVPPPSDFPVFTSVDGGIRSPATSHGRSGSGATPSWILAGGSGAEVFFDDVVFWRAEGIQGKMEISCENGPFHLTGLYPPRTGGQADKVADDGYVVFGDNRDGDDEIYFKRSAGEAPDILNNVRAAALPCPQVGFQVDWDPDTSCDTDHYRVHYRQGTSAFTLDVPGPPAIIDDLDVNSQYSYFVTTIDQACQEGPWGPAGIISTGTCDFVIRSTGVRFEDECAFGLGDRNHVLEPGEHIANVEVEVVNYGTMVARNCTGVLTSTTPAVTVVPPATSHYPDLGAGGARNDTPFEFDLDHGYSCGTPVDFSLVLSCDEGSFPVPASLRTLPTPCRVCKDCDLLPGPVGGLMARKAGNDVEMSWPADPLATSGYNVWYVASEVDLARADMANRVPAGPANPVPGCADPDPADLEACTHAGAIADPAPLWFYQVKAYCSRREGP